MALDRLGEELESADVVISSTGAPHAILDTRRIARLMQGRPAHPLTILDISVPRDVEADVGEIPGVSLCDIDDVERVVEANLNGRRQEAERGEDHVRQAVGRFGAWRRGREAGPAIASLRQRAEAIRKAELERAERGWQGLTDADRERLEALTTGIVNKILHEPTVRAREAAEAGDTPRHLESLRHLFGLPASPPA